MSGTRSTDDVLTLDKLRAMVDSMPPRPEVERVMVTRLAGPGSALLLTKKRWMLVNRTDASTITTEPRATASLYGMPVEYVADGSPREREIAEEIAGCIEAASPAWAPTPPRAPQEGTK